MVIASFAILLILIAISAIVYRNYRNNREANPSKKYRLKKLLDNEDTIEALENLVTKGQGIQLKTLKNMHIE